jgi:hypothetical protein
VAFNDNLLAAIRQEALDAASDCPSDAVVIHLGKESLVRHNALLKPVVWHLLVPLDPRLMTGLEEREEADFQLSVVF